MIVWLFELRVGNASNAKLSNIDTSTITVLTFPVLLDWTLPPYLYVEYIVYNIAISIARGAINILYSRPSIINDIVFIQNRLDTYKWFEIADYIALFSDSEADSYLLKEGLFRNIPILVTPLPYLEEIGVKDGENAYILKFDCSNVDEVANKVKNIPKFTYKKQEDKYNELFTKKKSHYKKDLETLITVECLDSFSLSAFNDVYNLKRKNIYNNKSGELYLGDIFDCDQQLADYLMGNNANGTIVVKEIKKTP